MIVLKVKTSILGWKPNFEPLGLAMTQVAVHQKSAVHGIATSAQDSERVRKHVKTHEDERRR